MRRGTGDGLMGAEVEGRLVVGRSSEVAVPAVLVAVAVVGWWWSVRMAIPAADGGMGMDMGMSMSLGAFVVAWVAMMAAMMFPAIIPVVRLYQRAAARGRAAPTLVFVAGYLATWAVVGLPVWWVWRALEQPLASGAAWAGRVAGATLLVAAAYQLTPLKAACLRHCRSPMGFFLHVRGDLRRPTLAARAGAHHGLWCLGCCWALMAVLVAVGTMHLVWMAALTAVIFVEKVLPRGELVGRTVAIVLVAIGAVLVFDPVAIVQVR